MEQQVKFYKWQYLSIYRPQTHFCLYGGVGSGKTFTGSHYVLDCIERWPGLSGLVGANTYDQLSQATLRELIFWLDNYKYEYYVDQKPPNQKKKFKSYKNIITVKNKAIGTYNHIFTRVMSKPNPLRGIEFTWYWLDEIKDTPEVTHDVVLGRMRESEHMRGLVTGTTNGHDWSYKRFCLNPDKTLYGFTHVRTLDAVNAGFITLNYYESMRASYTPLMASQELDAQHVNFGLGRAYYTSAERNATRVSPWGTTEPDPLRPLVIGCDFNYSPAPCVWVIGQLGPELGRNEKGEDWSENIHWFFEIAEPETSTPQMARILLHQTGGNFLRVYGDASGTHGTTSNAGETDYNQMAFEFSQAGRGHTIDVEMSNPIVRNRVENVNRMLMAADGKMRMTYNPERCPLLHDDLKYVKWKATVGSRRARLDDGGVYTRTHAADAVGYAIWKVFPPNLRGLQITTVERPRIIVE